MRISPLGIRKEIEEGLKVHCGSLQAKGYGTDGSTIWSSIYNNTMPKVANGDLHS